jgi:hypothetical protein
MKISAILFLVLSMATCNKPGNTPTLSDVIESQGPLVSTSVGSVHLVKVENGKQSIFVCDSNRKIVVVVEPDFEKPYIWNVAEWQGSRLDNYDDEKAALSAGKTMAEEMCGTVTRQITTGDCSAAVSGNGNSISTDCKQGEKP